MCVFEVCQDPFGVLGVPFALPPFARPPLRGLPPSPPPSPPGSHPSGEACFQGF